jgi:hypothetical protein
MSTPSLRTRVTAATSEATWPSTRVYAPWLAEAIWATKMCSMLPEPLVPIMVELLPPPASLPLLATLRDCASPSLLETAVSDGPVRHDAVAPPSW